MRRSRDDLPTDRVQWKNDRALWGDLRSTLTQGDSLIYPFTVRQVRRVRALQARAAALGYRVRVVTGLHQDKLYVWMEEKVGKAARLLRARRDNVVPLIHRKRA